MTGSDDTKKDSGFAPRDTEEACPSSDTGKHCWHNGSDMDSASYGSGGGFTVTHFMCCHCGLTRQERREWSATKCPDSIKHGEHSWMKARSMYESRFASQSTERKADTDSIKPKTTVASTDATLADK